MVNNNPRFNNAFTTTKQFFLNKDTNKDGALNTSEVFGTNPTNEQKNLLSYIDFDNNGTVSMAEMTLAIRSSDANGDGQLSDTESATLTSRSNALALTGKSDFNYQLLSMQLSETQALIQQLTPVIPIAPNVSSDLTAADKTAIDTALATAKTTDINKDGIITLQEAFGAAPTAEQQALFTAMNVDKAQGVDLSEFAYGTALNTALGNTGAVAKLGSFDAASNLERVRTYIGSLPVTPAPPLPPVVPVAPLTDIILNNAYTSATQDFTAKDTNKDKFLTSAEAFGTTPTAQQQRLYTALDYNNDNKLSKAELILGETIVAQSNLENAITVLTNAKASPQSATAQAINARLSAIDTFIASKEPVTPPAPILEGRDKVAIDNALASERAGFGTKDVNKDNVLTLTEAFGANPTAAQQRLYNAINVDKAQGVDLSELTFANALSAALGTDRAITLLADPANAAVFKGRIDTVRSYIAAQTPTPVPAPMPGPAASLSIGDQIALRGASFTARQDIMQKDTNQDRLLTLTEAFGANPTPDQQRLFNAINVDKTQGVDLAELTFATALTRVLGSTEATIATLSNLTNTAVYQARIEAVRSFLATQG